MPGTDAYDAKERVRQAVDIVDVVRDYLGELRREGRGFKALCPWHDDSRPSLTIDPARQTFKCWVCDIGGDIFSFVMRHDGVSFPEALKSLAERAGVTLPSSFAGKRSEPDKKPSLYEVMAWAESKYHDCLLRLPEGEPARRYLKNRGINDDSIRRFHLGAAPDSWSWLQTLARKDNVDPSLLSAAGVLGKRQGGPGYYDRFKARLLFSIRDPQDRAVGFGGRVLPEFNDQNTAKYINSPETPLFSKSKLLYGLEKARDEIRKAGHAVVVEGYTDCLIAHQCGIKNVVAVLGTALGPLHIKALRPYADQIVLVLDGDEAGRRRTNEVLELFVEQQVDLRILTLPQELDPCDFLLQQGEEAFRQLLSGAVDALEHKFLSVREGLDLSRGTHQAHGGLEDILATLAKAPRMDGGATALRQARMLSRLAHLSGVDEPALRNRLSELRKAARRRTHRSPMQQSPSSPPPEAPQPVDPTAERWERLLLEVLLRAGDVMADVRQSISADHFASPQCRAVYSACCALHDNGQTPDFDRLLLEIEDPLVKSVLVELDDSAAQRAYCQNADEARRELTDILASIRHRDYRTQHGRDTALLKRRDVEDGQAQLLLNQIVRRQRERQGLS